MKTKYLTDAEINNLKGGLMNKKVNLFFHQKLYIIEINYQKTFSSLYKQN